MVPIQRLVRSQRWGKWLLQKCNNHSVVLYEHFEMVIHAFDTLDSCFALVIHINELFES